ncbi:hypothetical protein MRX96_029297 [Rhipicephalus microplus]
MTLPEWRKNAPKIRAKRRKRLQKRGDRGAPHPVLPPRLCPPPGGHARSFAVVQLSISSQTELSVSTSWGRFAVVMPWGALSDGVPSAAKGVLVARTSIGDGDLASAHWPREKHAVWPARSALPPRRPGSHRCAVTRHQA